jgi:hypothetical protein
MKYRLWAVCAVAVSWNLLPLPGQVRTAPQETIWLGTNLKLGMPEDAAIKNLTESGYKLEKVSPVPEELQKKEGITSMWATKEKHGDAWLSHDLGFAGGKLKLVSKELPTGDEVEFGRQLYFALRELETEGNSRCMIETDSEEGPDLAIKSATLHCGKKQIYFNVSKFSKQSELVTLQEELVDNPSARDQGVK